MKTLRIVLLAMLVFTLAVTPLLAQTPKVEDEVTKLKADYPRGNLTLSGASIGAGLGAALTIVGAGFGFGRIGAAALESMARQPEVAGRVQTAMIIIAALLEGATLFALVVCIIVAGAARF